MLKFYFSTVIIYTICIWATIQIFGKQFKTNMLKITEKEYEKLDGCKYKSLFILSAVPILRLITILLIIWIALMNDKTIEEIKEKVKAKIN